MEIIPPSDFGIQRLASQHPVVIFSKSQCPICYSVKSLFNEQLGVNAVVHELDLDPRGREMERVLMRMGCNPAVPAVFIGGTLIGGVRDVMRFQLNGSLTTSLKQVGAAWT